jgi:Ca2+-transporting ATPase
MNSNQGSTPWHALSLDEIQKELAVDFRQGLSSEEVSQRLEKYGPNELTDTGGINPWKLLLAQFTETMVIVLIVAAGISLFLQEYKDAIAILAIVVLNALLGFRQEYQAEKAMEALKKLAVPNVRVRRGGHVLEIPAAQLVPGDVILLEAGNLIPADSRVVESANLRAQEAALTGESEPVGKQVNPVAEKNASLADRKSMLYMGTIITYGRGAAVVAETGMKTELGKIAGLIQSTGNERTPLQQRLDQLGKGLAAAAVVLVLIVAGIGYLRGNDLRELFLTAISMAVAAVPEGLPALVTIALALGARRMLRRNALIRKLPAVETLGSVTVICSDKTGTLTENRMTVAVVDVANHRVDLKEESNRYHDAWHTGPCAEGEPNEKQREVLSEFPALSILLAGGALCNDAILECDQESPEDLRIVGDPTEGALVVAASRMGMGKDLLEELFPRVAEVPFDSDRKRMTTVHKLPDYDSGKAEPLRKVWTDELWPKNHSYISFTKGAMDTLLKVSTQIWTNNNFEPINDEWRTRIEEANASLAKSGMRVLGVAFRALAEAPENATHETLENELTFVGLVGMIDPARKEVKDAVNTCKEAGIRPIMITGDHPLTAGYIARELGIDTPDGRVITGQELEKMSAETLEDTVANHSVYARVSPENKLQIVDALQNRGQIVAMTGDGVNDAPALRKADIGVAMGITGTDVSKEAADMVLVDDNFATIVAAVEEGRTIYDNIRKFIKYTLSSNTGEIWVMLVAPFLGMIELPLLPLQILWINLVTDGLPGLALGVEPPEKNSMKRPPHPPSENIFARGLGIEVLWVGILVGLLSLGVGFLTWRAGDSHWQTLAFSTLVFAEMGYVMAIRSDRYSLFTMKPNWTLFGAVALTFLLQLGVIYLPFAQSIFETESLPLNSLLLCIGLGVFVFLTVETKKLFVRIKDKDS